MTPSEYQTRVAHNTQQLQLMLKNKTSDFSQFYTFNSDPQEESLTFYAQKSNDLISAAAAGCLIYSSRVGADAAYLLDDKTLAKFDQPTQRKYLNNLVNSTYIDVELKLCTVDSEKIFRSINDTLYVAKNIENAAIKNKQQSLRSAIEASYQVHSASNRQSKNIMTMLTVFDRVDNQILDTFCADGDGILQYLNRSKNNKRTVKLSHFFNNGVVLSRQEISVGYEQWENNLKKTCPIFYTKSTFKSRKNSS